MVYVTVHERYNPPFDVFIMGIERQAVYKKILLSK